MSQDNDLYRIMFESAVDAMLLLEVDRFVECNASALTLYGCGRADIIGETPVKFSPPTQPDGRPSAQAAQERIGAALAGQPQQFEWLHQRLDGTPLYVLVSLHRIDVDGHTLIQVSLRDITERYRMEKQVEAEARERTAELRQERERAQRYLSIAQGPDAIEIGFEDLFDLDEIQRLQDEFAQATGVASIITRPDGVPITRPSNFCHLCIDIIRQTDKGRANCFQSDAMIGRYSPDGPTVQPCMSGGLWDAGAGIAVGGRHIANWLIGQVRDETQSEETIRAYARAIEADEAAMVEAFSQVPAMSREQFEKIAQVLFTLTTQFSTIAYQNVQQAHLIAERARLEEAQAVSYQRREREVRTTIEVAQEVATTSSLDALFERVVTLVKERFGYYHAQIFRHNAAQDAMALVYGYGEAGASMLAAGHRLPMGQGVVGTAAATGESVLVTDVTQSADWQPNPNLPDTRGELAVPIKWRGEVLGILDVQSAQAGALDEDDRLLLEGLCGQIAIAIENTRLLSETGAQQRLLQAVLDNTPLGVFVVEAPTGRPILVNRRSEEMLGKGVSPQATKDELAEVYAAYVYGTDELYPPERMPLVRGMFGESASVDDMEIRRSDGQRMALQIHGAPIRDENGQITSSVAVFEDITGRKQVQERIEAEVRQRTAELQQERDRAQRLASILQAANDLVSTARPDGTLTYLNRAGYRMLGWPEEESLEGHIIADLHPRPMLEMIEQQGIPVTLDKGIWQGETAILRRDGVEVPVDQVIMSHRSKDGELLYLSTIMRDISERKQVEESLRVNEERLSLALESGRVGIWEFWPQSGQVYYNPTWYTMLGYEPYELSQDLGTWAALLHPDDAPRANEIVMAGVQAGQDFHFQFRMRTKEGGWRWIQAHGYVTQRTAEGSAERIIGTHTDITEQKLAEDQLRANEERLSNALQIAQMAYWEFDVESQTFTFNDQYYRTFHNTTTEAMGGNQLSAMEFAQRFTPPEEAAQVGANIQKAVMAEDPNFQMRFESRNLTVDGQERWVSVWLTIEKDRQGRTIRLRGVNQDISERKRAEDELRQSQGRLQGIAANVPGVVYQFYALATGEMGMTYVSERAAIVFGLEANIETFFPQFVAHVHPDDQASFMASIQKAVAAAQSWNYEGRLVKSSGEVIWFSGVSTPVKVADRIIFSGLLLDVTERKQIEIEVQKRATELQVVAQIGVVASTILEPQKLLTEIVELTRTSLSLSHVGIYLADQDFRCLRLAAGTGQAGQQMVAQGWQVNLDDDISPIARAWSLRQGVIVDDVRAVSNIILNPLLSNTRAELSVPLIVGERVIGVLDVQSDQPGRFTSQDLVIQTTLAGQTAVALQNAQFVEQVERSLRETEVRLDVSRALAVAETEQQVWEILLAHSGLYPDAAVGLYAFEEEGGQKIQVTRAFSHFATNIAEEPVGTRFPADEFEVTALVASGQQVLIDNIFTDERMGVGMRQDARKLGYLSLAATPISLGDAIIGLIVAHSPRKGYFDAAKLHLYATLAEQGAVSLQAVRLRDRLTTNEERLSLALGAGRVGIWEFWPQSGQVYYNPTWYTMLGYEPYELSQDLGTWAALLHPDDAPRANEIVMAGVQAGQDFHFQFRMRTKEGGWRWIQAHGYVTQRTAEGSAERIIGTHTDITEQKLAEESLQITRASVERSTDAFYWFDEQARFIDVNETTLQLLGYTRDEILSLSVFDIDPTFPHEAWEPLKAQLGERGTLTFEGVNRAKSGVDIVVDVVVSRIQFGEREIYFSIARDIRQRKQTERRLQAQYAATRVLAESPTWSEAVDRILQSVGEGLGWEWGEFWEPDAGQEVLECRGIWHHPSFDMSHFETITRQITFASGTGLPGRVWASGEPAWIPDVTRDTNFPRAQIALQDGLHGAFAFPVIWQGKVLAVLGFLSRDIQEPDPDLLSMFGAIGSQMGQFMERRRVEAAVLRERDLTNALIDSLPGVFYLYDDQGRLLRWNKNYQQVVGYSEDEMRYSYALDMVTEESRQLVGERIMQVYTQGEAGVEAYLRSRSGATVPYYLTGRRIIVDGKPYLVGAGVDISDRVQVEREREQFVQRQIEQAQVIAQVSQELAGVPQLEEMFRRVVNLIHGLGYYHAQVFRYDPAQDAMSLVYGYGEAGAAMRAAGHNLPMGRGVVGTAAATGESVLVTDVRQNPDWQPNPHLPDTQGELAVPIKLREQVLGVLDVQSDRVGALTDDDRILLESLSGPIALSIENTHLLGEAATQQRTLQTVLDNIPVGVFVAEASTGRPILVNRRSEEMLGKGVSPEATKDELAQVYAAYLYGTDELYSPERMPLVRGMFGESASVDDMEIRRPDGQRMLLQVQGVPIRDESGQIVSSVAVFQDITESKRAAAEMAERLRELDALYRTMTREQWQAFRQTAALTGGYEFDPLTHTIAAVDSQALAAPTGEETSPVRLAPLQLRGETIGMVGLYQNAQAPFDPEQEALVEAILEQAAQALESARLSEMTQSALAETRALYNLSGIVGRELDVDVIYRAVSQSLVQDLGYSRSWIVAVDHESHTIQGMVGQGIDEPRSLSVFSWTDRQNPILPDVLDGHSMVINDPIHDPRMANVPPEAVQQLGKVAQTPVLVGSSVQAVVVVGRPLDAADIGEEDLRLLEAVAAQLAVAIQRADLFRRTQEALAEAEQTHRRYLHEAWSEFLAGRGLDVRGYMADPTGIVPIRADEPGSGGLSVEGRISLPLQVRGQVIGVLDVAREAAGWGEAEQEMIAALAQQLGDLIESERLFEQSQATLAETERLYQVSQRITRAETPQQVFQVITDVVADTSADTAAIFSFEMSARGETSGQERIEVFWNRAGIESPMPSGTTRPIGENPFLSLFGAGQALFCADTWNDPRLAGPPRTAVEQMQVRALALVPLAVGDEWMGYVLVSWGTPHIFAPEEQRIYRAVGDQAAVVLRSQRLRLDAERRAHREQLIREITARMRAHADVDSILNTAVRELAQQLGVSRAFVRLSTGMRTDDSQSR